MKVKKKFDYEGIELRIVEREEAYMNATSTMLMLRVIAPNGCCIPVNIPYKATLKAIQVLTVQTLNGFKERGANVIAELTK